jgi:PAS domain S-box-containing protein
VPKSHRTAGVNRALWALGALVVAGMAIFQVYDVARRRDIVIETTVQAYATLARALAVQTARSLQAVDVVVRDTAADVSSAPEARATAELNERLRRRLPAIPQVDHLLVVGAQGNPVASAARAGLETRALADPADYAFHRDHRSTELRISAAFRKSGDGHWTVALSRRIERRDARFAGVVVAFLDLDYFRASYAAVDPGPGAVVSLYREDGELLARYPEDDAAAPGSRIDRPLSGAGGAARILHASVGGQEMIYADQAVRSFPLVMRAAADRATVLRPWNVQAMHSAFRTSLLCASVLLLMWLVMRELRRRERAEERLRVQTAHLDELFESAPEAIVMLDLGQRVIRVNREFTRMFGFPLEEAEGRRLEELIVPAHLAAESEQRAREVSAGRHTATETERMRKDGARLQVSELGAPIVTATGQIAAYAIYRDITERRLAEAERGKLELRLRQAEKLEAIGTMAGGIAHDFNNILAAILGYGDLAFTVAQEGSPLKRYVANALSAAHRAKALVNQILTYSRSTRGKRAVVDVCTVVEETLELVRASLPAGIELHAQLDAGRSTVIADATQVHQLVMNLCTNAIQAMEAEGTLRIGLERVDSTADSDLSHGLLPAGRYVRLSVRDTGCGMEPAVLTQIFEPFFTTKEPGTGTGLGLALVLGIVTDLGGAIHVSSRTGEGSAFELYLPRSDAAVLEAATDRTPLQKGNGELVLLVENDQPLMLLVEEMLAALGYEPAGFTRAAEALQEFERDTARFDAVVLDYLMPDMTGTEFARQLRKTRSDVPVVLISGYRGPLLLQEALSAGVDQVLTKPLDLRALAEALALVLARARPAERTAASG